MFIRSSRSAAAIVAASSMTLWPADLRGDIIGFNNLSGWTYNQSDSSTPADLPAPDTIHVTNLGTSQARSIFFNTRQDISQFQLSFVYRAANADTGGCDYGATFTIHNDPRGPEAIGTTGRGLAYGRGSLTNDPRITNSAAISLQLGSNSTGYYTGGNIGSPLPSGPVILTSGNPIAVTLGYDGNFLTERLVDTVTLQEFSRNLIIGDVASIVGGSTAYVGFTASTTTGQCSGHAADQYFSDFVFGVPGPSAAGLLGCVGIASARRRRR